MKKSGTIGERLLELKGHSGLSLNEIARRAGYRAASSIQKLFSSDYDPPSLKVSVVDRLKVALVGTGSPPIQAAEIDVLGSASNREPAAAYNPSRVHRLLSRTIEVFATQQAEEKIPDLDGNVISVFEFLRDEGEKYICPPHLRADWIWAFYVSTSNMMPRYDIGELLFYQLRPPPKIGDDIILEIANSSETKTRYLLAKLTNVDADTIVVTQLNPPVTLTFPRMPTVRPMRILRHADFVEPRTHNAT